MNSYDKILSYEEDTYKQLYEESKQRRSQINSKIIPTLTMLTTESTATIWIIFKIVNDIKSHKNVILLQHLCPIIFTLLTIASVITAIIFLILCLTRYNFSYTDPKKVDACISLNKKYLEYYTEEELINNIRESLVKGYKKNCILNWEETNKHVSHLRFCYRFIIIALALLVVDFSFVLFL